MIRWLIFIFIIAHYGDALENLKGDKKSWINKINPTSSIIIVNHKESVDGKLGSQNEVESWKLDNEESDWLMEINENENQNRRKNLERNEYKLVFKSNGEIIDNGTKSRSDGRSPENGTRLDASGYEGDFTRKSESNGDKLGEMRNVTAVIGPKYDSSYVPFREEQMSTIEEALDSKKENDTKKYSFDVIRKSDGKIFQIENSKDFIEQIKFLNCTMNKESPENLRLEEPEIYSIKAFIADNPKVKKEEPTAPEIYAIFGEIEDNPYNGSKVSIERAKGESKNDQTLSNLEMEPALNIKTNEKDEDLGVEGEGGKRGIKEWMVLNKTGGKENGGDEFQNESKFDWEKKWKTNYDFEKKSNHSFTDSISRKEPEVTTEESIEIINTSKKARPDGRKFIENPTLFFEDIPDPDPYEISNLKLSDGTFVFSYLGDLLSLFEPVEFPADLVKDILWRKSSFLSLAARSLKIEAGFIICSIVGLALGLSIPVLVLVYGCPTICGVDELSEEGNHDGEAINCRRKALVFLLTVVILLTGAGLTAMFVTNEQLSAALRQFLQILEMGLNDISTYLKNAQKQLIFVVVTAFDKAVTSLTTDLDNIGHLLGIPIQNEIAVETGVDVALDALTELASGSQSISRKVGMIKDESRKLKVMTESVRERLADLRQQLDGLRRQCSSRDRLLCETIDSSGLEISFRIDSLINDPKLTHLKILVEDDLVHLIEKAKMRFELIPHHVDLETKGIRLVVFRKGAKLRLVRQSIKNGQVMRTAISHPDIKTALNKRKSSLDNTIWPFENLARDLKIKVEDTRDIFNGIEDNIVDIDYWRWLIKLGSYVTVACFAVLLVWLLLFSAVGCSSCLAKELARLSLIASVITISISSTFLWFAASGIFFIGGHGEVFICRPLFDEPEYATLTKLFDDPGIVFARRGGFFSNAIHGNQSLNVPLKEILQECKIERPMYKAFQLDRILDLDSASDHYKWDSFHLNLENLKFNLTELQILDSDLHIKLQSLLQTTTVNLTSYRTQLMKTITGKDLNSFSKHLDHIANQMKDLSTASRIETLASRTRRVAVNFLHPLQSKQEDLIYQLTALEVQMKPLQREVNQTLSHLKTIQYFIDNRGNDIAREKAKEYSNRLVSYLEQYRDYVSESLNSYVAPCKPIWDFYHAFRFQLCRHLMDPLNGFWFSVVLCLLSITISIPLSLKLIYYYNLERKGLLTSSNGRSVISESGDNWNASGSARSNGW